MGSGRTGLVDARSPQPSMRYEECSPNASPRWRTCRTREQDELCGSLETNDPEMDARDIALVAEVRGEVCCRCYSDLLFHCPNPFRDGGGDR